MAINDLTIFDQGAAYPGDNLFDVAAQSTTVPLFNPGEVAFRALGAGEYVTSLAASTTNRPAVGTDYIAGVTSSTSTETATVDGKVNVTKFDPFMTFLITPGTPATYGVGSTPNQTTYNALIGSRVLLTSSAQVSNVITTKLLAADSANNGLVVMPLDVVAGGHPGKVRVAFRAALNYLA